MRTWAALVSLAVVACSSEGEMGQQNLTLQARGLYLTSNPLDAPPGSLSEATNAVIRRRGVVEPRRGQRPDATVPSSAYVDSMASFEGELIVHTSADALGIRASDTTITAYSGTYTAPANNPTRFVEAAGGLYATTNAGPVRLDSPAGAWTAAGEPPGLEGSATTTGTSGWLPYLSTVGYRLVWGKRDGDGQLMLGAPSGRILLTNEVQNSNPLAFTWARAGAVITATDVAHGLTTGDLVVIVTSSDTSAIPLAVYSITVTGVDTFTFTGVDAGGASGSGTYVGDDPGTRDGSITTPIPDGIALDVDFLQVYRTLLTTTGGADPGEDMAQVGEFFPSLADISAGSMTVTDIASFASGPTGYFSPSMGIGLSGAKEQPPLVTDMVVFNGYMFGVVQAYRQELILTLLGTGGGTGIQDTDGLIFYEDGAEVFRIIGNATEDASIGQFLVETMDSAAVNIETTARSIVRVINAYSSSNVYAQYVSNVADLPGKILITARRLHVGQLSVRGINKSSCWVPRLGIEIAANAISRTGSTVTAAVGSSLVQSLSVGLTISLIGVDPSPEDPDFPFGTFTITATDPVGTFDYTQAGAAVSGSKNYYFFETPDVGVFNQAATGSDYAFSDLEEPDAWPPRFRYKVGGPNSTLYRIIPQGNALIFFTSDGLFRLTGRTADEFVLLPMDPTVQLVGPKTAIGMGNRAFVLTNQGVISITDLGVEKISEPIDQALLPYYAGTLTELTNEAAFGMGYQTENEYTLFLQSPEAGSGDPPDRAYTFNTQTGTWVGPWEFSWAGINTNNAVRSAFVNAGDGRLYIAAGTRLTRERKARNLTDYQDSDNVGIPVDVATVVNTANNPGAFKQWVESTVLLEAPQPSSMELYFTTELDSVEEGVTITSQGNAAVRSYIPRDKSRSARLTIGMRCSLPQQKMTILGYQTVANVSSTRVGR